MPYVAYLRRVAGASAAALALGVSANANAAAALEWTASIIDTADVTTRSCTVDTLLPHLVTLVDNRFLASFDFLSLAITRTGGATQGTPLTAPGTFQFTPTQLGSYTAVVFGDPGTFSGRSVGTFG